jgi:CrcB protein
MTMSRQPLLPYLLVGAGGFIGAIARFAVSRWVVSVWTAEFPLGTFVINISGSFLLGILATLTTSRAAPDGDPLRLALGVGFLGAFTTFSTFEFETHSLFKEGAWFTGATYVFLSLAMGLMAVRLGIMAARTWWP